MSTLHLHKCPSTIIHSSCLLFLVSNSFPQKDKCPLYCSWVHILHSHKFPFLQTAILLFTIFNSQTCHSPLNCPNCKQLATLHAILFPIHIHILLSHKRPQHFTFTVQDKSLQFHSSLRKEITFSHFNFKKETNKTKSGPIQCTVILLQ